MIFRNKIVLGATIVIVIGATIGVILWSNRDKTVTNPGTDVVTTEVTPTGETSNTSNEVTPEATEPQDTVDTTTVEDTANDTTTVEDAAKPDSTAKPEGTDGTPDTSKETTDSTVTEPTTTEPTTTTNATTTTKKAEPIKSTGVQVTPETALDKVEKKFKNAKVDYAPGTNVVTQDNVVYYLIQVKTKDKDDKDLIIYVSTKNGKMYTAESKGKESGDIELIPYK